jgi:endo-beta-N-acetylglucosaminidase D
MEKEKLLINKDTSTCNVKLYLFNLGTFITEWDDGKARCQKLLESEDSYREVASKLVEITKYYKFDGWLINIENVIEVYITVS